MSKSRCWKQSVSRALGRFPRSRRLLWSLAFLGILVGVLLVAALRFYVDGMYSPRRSLFGYLWARYVAAYPIPSASSVEGFSDGTDFMFGDGRFRLRHDSFFDMNPQRVPGQNMDIFEMEGAARHATRYRFFGGVKRFRYEDGFVYAEHDGLFGNDAWPLLLLDIRAKEYQFFKSVADVPVEHRDSFERLRNNSKGNYIRHKREWMQVGAE